MNLVKKILYALLISVVTIFLSGWFVLSYKNGKLLYWLFYGKMDIQTSTLMRSSIKVSPDGNRIVFWMIGEKWSGFPAVDIFMMDMINNEIVQLTKDGTSEHPSFVDNERIVFMSSLHDGEAGSVINLMDLRSKTINELSRTPYFPLLRVESNQKDRIFFSRFSEGSKNNYHVVLHAYDISRDSTTEIDNNFEDKPPATEANFSDLGWQVIPGTDEVLIDKGIPNYIFDTRKSVKANLSITDVSHCDYHERKLACLQKAVDRKSKVMIADIKNGATKTLTKAQGIYSMPKWSPDGNQLAYSSNEDGRWHLWTYDLTSSKISNIGNGYVEAWLNNDEILAVKSKALYRVSRDGKQKVRIISHSSQN